MLPNLKKGEYFVANKVIYDLEQPKRGDIIVYKDGIKHGDFVKRIIGLPGEKIKVEGGRVYINSEVLTESYLYSSTHTSPGKFLTEGIEILIPLDNYVVMGDNRDMSYDSRDSGFVDRKYIIGKYWFRYH